MVRVEGSLLFDREAILGRDSSSVFPSTRASTSSNGLGGKDKILEALGGRSFVTESEIEELKASRVRFASFLFNSNVVVC